MSSIQATTSIQSPSGLEQRPTLSAAIVREPAQLPHAGPDIPSVAVGHPSRSEPNQEELRQITEELKHRLAADAPELEFSIDQSTGQTIVRIIDPTTKEIIKQIPSEQMLAIAKALEQFQKGVLLDRTA